jgi:PAS domain S-box-containing protein
MNWHYHHYSLLYFSSAAISAWLFIYGWQRRQQRGAVPFLTFITGIFIWAFAKGIEAISLTVAEKVFWANIQYFGAAVIPVAWLIFTFQYTGRASYINKRSVLLLSLIPAITIALAWTNEFHGLIRTQVGLRTDGLFPQLSRTFGLWFNIHLAYSYTLTGIGVLLIFNLFIKSNKIYRRQATVLLLGALAPWVTNILYFLRVSPMHQIDFTPTAFTITGIAMALGVFRFHLLDVIPVAYETVIEELHDGIIVLDTEERLVEVNPAAQKIIGKQTSEIIGSPLTNYLDLDINSKTQLELSLQEKFYDVKNSLLFDKRGKVSGRLIVLSDITERKQIEKQFAQVEKLAAVGRFLSGTAHELNNPLTSILGFAQLLLSRETLDANIRKKIEIIHQEADRSRTIVQNLFAFVGQAKMMISTVDVNALLAIALELRKEDLQAAGIEIHFEMTPLPVITGDLQQLQRAFLNVLINAEQAVQTKAEKKQITIQTRLIEQSGVSHIEVTVADNGIGIGAENLGKIFEPFFTTRPVGKGMGLGLSISYGIVSKHGGKIFAENQHLGGAKFIVNLPITSDGQVDSTDYRFN